MEKTRYEQIKELGEYDMAVFLSWYFNCVTRCPARKDDCFDNDAMCVDAIREWLKQEGQL